MKIFVGLMALSAALLTPQFSIGQAPAGVPAGSTGLCNDGTYTKGTIKISSCMGHKGLKTWYGVPKTAAPEAKPATTTTAAAPAATPTAPAPKTAAAPASSAKGGSTMAAAPGGGPGLVWVNTASNVYHCPGTTYYGKTKAGAYMSEDQAKAKGAHANGGKGCSVK